MTCHKISGLTALALTFMFAACGGDSGSNADEKLAVVSSIDKLDDCTDKLEGDTVFVKSEKADYICSNGKWINADSSETQSDEAVSSSSSKADEIFSSTITDDTTTSSSSLVENQSSSSFIYEQNSSAYVQPPVVAIKNKSITGVSQKGPFVTGSAVKVYELDGKTYAQTGKSFTGKISSDDGKFSVSSVTLASQYALLEADGYFRNEVTGEKSIGKLTLNALTDLSDRKSVNINLLTHLEYERVLYLVGTGINIPAAKKQAEAEILNAFGIKGDFANSEDLDIFSKGDDNAALLAFSMLMLRDLSEADLTELLTKFATDIEEDGTWDDEATKAKIADWAQAKDLAGGLTTIRSYINKWDLGTVPNFEKFVRNFWYTNYGLGACATNNKDEVLATKNKLSDTYNTQTRFICKDGAWIEATDIEKDTYQWTAGKDGEIKIGSITKTVHYVYDAESNEWRNATFLETALGGGCTEAREADITSNTGKVNGTWYICKSRTWQSTNNITVDTQGWIKGSDGDLQKGDSTNVIYKYDEALDKWVQATYNDTTLNLMGCTTNRTGEIGRSSTDSNYYVCKKQSSNWWNETQDDIFDWQLAQEYDYDTYQWTTGEEGETRDGIVTGKKYIFDVEWRLATPKETRWGLCNASKEGSLNNDESQICTNGDWIWVGGLIDDFEDGNTIAETLGDDAYWYLYEAGGTISNTRDEQSWIWNMISTDNDNSYAAMNGIGGITSGATTYPSVGMGVDFGVGVLAQCTAIQYDYKGSGHHLRGLVDGVRKDRGYEHVAPNQNASSGWTTVTVSVMTQPDWVAVASPSDVKTFSWAGVKGLAWVVNESLTQENIGTYLYIDNVKCIP